MGKLTKLEKKAQRKQGIEKLKRKGRIQQIRDRAFEIRYPGDYDWGADFKELADTIQEQIEQREVKERIIKRSW